MGPNGSGSGLVVGSGLFREHVPEADRPHWWPSDENGTPLSGFPIRRSLSVEARSLSAQRPGFNTTTLTRRLGIDSHAAPWSEFITRDEFGDLLDSSDYATFASRLESMEFHGWGHVWIGGLMGRPATSPNDPMFFLHHCMIDHAWALWQDKHNQSDDHHLPPLRAAEPQLRRGHARDDLMWPWDGTPTSNAMKAGPPQPGPFPTAGSTGVAPVFPDDTFVRMQSGNVRVGDVIDHRSLSSARGYMFDTQVPLVWRQEREVLAWMEPMFGDLNLLGTVREGDTGTPSGNALVFEAANGTRAWIDRETRDLHLPGRIVQEEVNVGGGPSAGNWVAVHYGQPLAVLRPSGDLHLKGRIHTNQGPAA